jgi:hypothetical protein
MDYPDPFDEKAPLRFQVRIKGIRANARLKFSWFVSAGYIKSGQGTPSVIVEAKGAQRQGLTATVVICGLPYECENEISRTTAVAKFFIPDYVAPWLISFGEGWLRESDANLTWRRASTTRRSTAATNMIK